MVGRVVLASFVVFSLVACSGGGSEPDRTVTLVDGAAITLSVAQRKTLDVIVDVGGGASDGLAWSSDDPAIVTVDEDGTITAVAPGVTYVAAVSTVFEDVSDAIAVTVESIVPVGATFGAYHALVLDVRGGVWAWGSNTSKGKLGDGTQTARDAPVSTVMPFVGGEDVVFVAVEAGGQHSMGVDALGNVWTWGDDFFGQAGNGDAPGTLVPGPVSFGAGTPVSIAALAAGQYHSIALDAGGTAWGWGDNTYGRLGDGTTTIRTAPVVVEMPEGASFLEVQAGKTHSLAVDDQGRVWAWGGNADGSLGDGTTESKSVPTLASQPAEVTAFANLASVGPQANHSAAVDVTGTWWTWGANGDGQLGIDSTTPAVAPTRVQVPEGVVFTHLALGSRHTVAIDELGRAWAWGANDVGQLGGGDSSEVDRLLPGEVAMPVVDGLPATFAGVRAGDDVTVAWDGAGRVWAWGLNDVGQVGMGDDSIAFLNTPTAVTFP